MSVNTKPGDRQFKPAVVPQQLICLPFYKVGMDVLGPYDNHYYITTLADYFTGTLIGRATTYCPTHRDVRLLLNSVYHVYGTVPTIVLSDNGSQFQVARREFPNTWLMTAIRGSPSNGLVERQHRCINAKLRRLRLQGVTVTTDRQWQDVVNRVLGELNNSPRPKAKGLCPLDILSHYPGTNVLVGARRRLPNKYLDLWKTYRQQCFERSANSVPCSVQEIKPGQLVYLRCPENANKMDARYSPQTVKSVLGSNRIELATSKVVHFKYLKILRNVTSYDEDDEVYIAADE
ncbi:hypothetical protein FOL47_002739 [Perkinsus chesapeaki]|uniref:Integrase catalytic domain-containing protein n=1 Tax=Perkinsus chesapeaki TaxID=330153 RepID=A0A7J6MBW3_PERCH|nr:hypothetical protein FOL47_002739 [Perkinsus chesapeaki]